MTISIAIPEHLATFLPHRLERRRRRRRMTTYMAVNDLNGYVTLLARGRAGRKPDSVTTMQNPFVTC